MKAVHAEQHRGARLRTGRQLPGPLLPLLLLLLHAAAPANGGRFGTNEAARAGQGKSALLRRGALRRALEAEPHASDAEATTTLIPGKGAEDVAAHLPAATAKTIAVAIGITDSAQGCSVLQHTWVVGPVLRSARDNLQAEASACCQACFNTPNCTAWSWCPLPGGCDLPPATPPDWGVQAGLPHPHLGCQLLENTGRPSLLREQAGQVGAVHLSTPDIPFASGFPVVVVAQHVAGYAVHAGSDVGRELDYPCPEHSLRLESCELVGTALELAAACDDNPVCVGFEIYPNGLDGQGRPIGTLKGGVGVDAVPLVLVKKNPHSVFYLKSAIPLTASREAASRVVGACGDAAGGGGSNTALWVVVPVVMVVALASIAGSACFAMAVHRRAQRREEALLAERRKRRSSSGGSAALRPSRAGSDGSLQAPLALHSVLGSRPSSSASDGSRSSSGERSPAGSGSGGGAGGAGLLSGAGV